VGSPSHLRLVCSARIEILRNELDNHANTSQKLFCGDLLLTKPSYQDISLGKNEAIKFGSVPIYLHECFLNINSQAVSQN